MASPFSVFRRNQKAMFAVLGVLVMFAFVFLPMCDDIGIQSAAPGNPVVVKTSLYGDLREHNLHFMLLEHRKILGVLADIGQAAGQHPALAQRQAEFAFGPPAEENVVNSWLLAQHGKRMGMVVSDEVVNAFLRQWTRDKVKAAELVAAFKRSGFSTVLFFNVMRELLMAQQLREMFFVSLEGIPPAQRWEYFTRVKRMATIEAAAVDVADYVDRVDEPTGEALKAFFEQHKDQYAVPGSPEPGFREPKKIAVQWFQADREKFLGQVTDEEIEEHYQKNKDLYNQLEQKPEQTPSEQVKDGEPAATPAEDAKEEKATEQPQDPNPNPSDAEGASKETSSLRRPSPFMLVSLLQEEKKEEEAAAPTPTVDAPAEETPSEPSKDSPVGQPPSAVVGDAAQPGAAAPPLGPEKSEPGMAETTRERIRQEIANEKLMKVFEGLREKMDQYRTAWSRYEVALIQQQVKKEGEKKTLPTPPPPPDFEQLAEENGLSTGRTGLLSQWEAQSTDIGASMAGGRIPVWRCAFDSMSEFRPEIAIDMKGDLFLFWKTEETKDRIPAFEDEGVRGQVLRAWKMIQARPLAVQEADALADEARAAKKTLKELLADRPDRKVIEPLPFSWITFGNVPLGSAPQAARISDVPGVQFAGPEFMRAVFQLDPGELGAALNAPKTIAYVIQLGGFSPSRDVLWKEFEVDDFNKYAPAAADEQREIVRTWFEELKEEAGMEWQREPDQRPESADGENE